MAERYGRGGEFFAFSLILRYCSAWTGFGKLISGGTPSGPKGEPKGSKPEALFSSFSDLMIEESPFVLRVF